jgi:hypothetical protein
MATGYWRVKVDGGVFQLQDHTPSSTTRGDLVVKINTPGRHTTLQAETLVDTTSGADATAEQNILTDAGYTYLLANPFSASFDIEAGDVPSVTTTTFPDGVYRFQADFDLSGTDYEFDEYLLHVPAIDKCISDKLTTYLASTCDKCKQTKQLNTLQELVVLRQGAQLDINANRITAAEKKVTLMSNICTGSSCTCICGCS